MRRGKYVDITLEMPATVLGERLSKEMDAYVRPTAWPALFSADHDRLGQSAAFQRRRRAFYKLKRTGWFIPGLRSIDNWWVIPTWSLPISPFEKRLWDACLEMWDKEQPQDPVGWLGQRLSRSERTIQRHLTALSGKIYRMNEARRSLGLPDTGF